MKETGMPDLQIYSPRRARHAKCGDAEVTVC
jgi:hypothetical protein